MNQASDVLKQLQALANPEKAAFKAKKFNIQANNTLGIYQVDLNEIAKKIGKHSDLAQALYRSDVYEAKLLCAKIFNPKDLTPMLMNFWCAEFNNWEICDTFCMKLFAYYEGIETLIPSWFENENEFIRRAGFATIAALCTSNKKALNAYFEAYLPFMTDYASDHRIYVKKAISWALRSIGKRNVDLQAIAIKHAHHLLSLNHPTATWIANDVLKELSSNNLRMSDYPRNLYRTSIP